MPDIFIAKEREKKLRKKKIPVSYEKKEEKVRPVFTKVSQNHKPTKNPFSAFAIVPRDVSFENQESEEKIILLLRAHPITNLGWLLFVLILFFAPIIVRPWRYIDFLPARFEFIVFILWYFLICAYFFEQFLNWYFNVYLVTDERVVDIDFHNILYKQVSECKIDKIQDVTYSQTGVLRSLFNFGDVMIQTAAEVTEFVYNNVPRPQMVTRIIGDLITEEEQEFYEGRVR